MTIYLMIVLFTKLRSPYSYKADVVDHTNLLAVLLSASADVIDYFEYMFELEIVDLIGLTALYCKKFHQEMLQIQAFVYKYISVISLSCNHH